MFSFITRRSLLANIVFGIAMVFVLLFLFLFSLNWITHHGKMLNIPQVTGKSLPDARKYLDDQGFDVVVQDSVYVDSLPALTVVKQFPDADAVVKVNRTVYLTVTRAAAPIIDMPNLVGLSFRSATIVLRQAGLKLGDTTSVPDFAKNSVKKQMFGGKDIAMGTKIPMGSRIDLVISAGIAEVEMTVPDLYGMTYLEAKVVMEGNSLNFGAKVVDSDVRDSANAYIYKQSPPRAGYDHRVNHIRQGQMIDIWLGTTRPVRSDSAGVSNRPNPAAQPNNNNY